MELQKRVLAKYLELSKRPTLKKIADETGIQVTRIFRILNGSEMKLSEFLVFDKLIEKKMGLNSSLHTLVLDCTSSLSADAIREIQMDIERRIQLSHMRHDLHKRSLMQVMG